MKISYIPILFHACILSCLFEESLCSGKPWCKGRNYPGGSECCESEDPEWDKCTEGQGDCDSDSGCAGNLVCGKNNCRDYHSDASPNDDCCTTASNHNYHGGKTGGLPSRLGPLGPLSSRTHGFRGKFNKAGNLPIPDFGVDFTKFNDKTYKEHYVDGFTKWNPGSVRNFNFELQPDNQFQASVSGTNNAGRAEASYGNKAFGHTVYAQGTGLTGSVGIENYGLGAKAGGSLGYQAKTDVSDSHVDAQYGVGANIESEIIPGNIMQTCQFL